MTATSSFAAFSEALAAGRGQVLFRERVADLDTPVGAFLRLVQGRPNAFLLESVEGGAARGRFSALGMEPDLVWRCRNGAAEINRHALSAPHAFVPDPAPPLDSLRILVKATRMPMPAGLPSPVPAYLAHIRAQWPRILPDRPARRRGRGGPRRATSSFFWCIDRP